MSRYNTFFKDVWSYFVFPIEDIRSQFPFFESDIVYLDTAATAQKPQVVIDAISQFYAHEYASVHRGIYALCRRASERYSGVREKIKNFFNVAPTSEVIFTRGTTDGINLVASSFIEAFLRPGDEVALFETAHHSNLVPWHLAARRYGIVLRPFRSIEEFKACTSEKLRLAALTHLSNATGECYPVEEICAFCRERGIYTLVDGAQSAAHMPIDLSQTGADFFVASAHKMYGPTGLGFLVGERALLDQMVPTQGGGDMIDEVGLESSSFQLSPMRFEAGTPMIAQVIGFGAALDFLTDVGMEKIYAWERDLSAYLVERLSCIEGVRLTTHPHVRASLVTFEVEGAHSLDVASLLDVRGICVRSGHLCAQPALQVHGVPSVLRASVGVYTTKGDIDILANALQEIIAVLAPISS